MGDATSKDFLGLRVLWPKQGEQLRAHDHDIVFIHGLHNGPVSDWWDGSTQFWLEDLLAKDMETARILSFGYDQTKPNVRNDSDEDLRIFNHAEALCSDLKDNNTLLKIPRPITFVGHGTGGIIIKAALCYSHAKNSLFGSILKRTKHTIFLDTPHLGLNADAWQSVSGGTPSNTSHGQYKLWSTVLSDIRKTFAELATRFNITSACASLTYSPKGFEDEVVPGDSGLTGLRNEHVLILEGVTHVTIAKFSRGVNYDRLLKRIQAGKACHTSDAEHIQQIRSWIGGGAGCMTETQSDSVRWNIDDYEKCREQYLPGTGQWLFKDSAFKDWADDHGPNRILWLTAPTGTGKSVLCYVARQSIASRPSRPATPYIMLAYNKERSKCQLAMLLASQLLDHVLKEEGGVDTEVLTLLNKNAADASNVHELIQLLVSQCSGVYFFLDGLNELRLLEAAGSLKLRDEAERLQNDLWFVLHFLSRLTLGESKTRVRLWCGSQKTDLLIDWIKRLEATELAIDKSLVQQDVQRYLQKMWQELLEKWADDDIPERLTDDEKTLTWVKLHLDAGSNFRWAYMMNEYLQKCKTPELLLKAVEKGLPKNLGMSYSERLKELIAQDKEESEIGPPLSKNILSLLTYARRPLRLAELQEALSVVSLRLKNGSCLDLSRGNTIAKKDIKYRCSPLVHFESFGDSVDEGYLQLSHGSVHEFLRGSHSTERSDVQRLPQSSSEPGIDCNVIADACLKYLSQRRYSKTLKKLSAMDFQTQSGGDPEDVRKHFFLQYSAKYWYRHLEDIDAQRCEQVKVFVRSPQFLTMIQVQSLFVVGHFINTFDNSNAPRRVMKRNMPEWLRNCDDGRSIMRNYECFISEWSWFLQLGITNFMNGEIQRCLWGALGKGNFLQELGTMIESNKSYRIGGIDEQSEVRTDSGHCFYETMSNDGTRISVWRVVPGSCDGQCTPPSTVMLSRETWYIDGRRDPIKYGPVETLTFEPSFVRWALYDPCRNRVYPLIPAADSPIRANPIGNCQYGLGVRIGSVEFLRETGGRWIAGYQKRGETPVPYWEEISIHGKYSVRSRRKLISLESEGKVRTELKGPSQATQKNSTTSQLLEDESECSDAEINRAHYVLGSSAEEYWSVGSSDDASPEEVKQVVENEDGRPPMNEGNSLVELSESEAESYSNSSSAGLSSDSRSVSPSRSMFSASSGAFTHSGCSATESEADDESSEKEHDHSDFEFQPAVVLDQPRIISTLPSPVYCDICPDERTIFPIYNKRLRHQIFYRCALCTPGKYFNLCSLCFDRGEWCTKRDHQLRKVSYLHGELKTLDIVSRDDSRLGINIIVESNTSNGAQPVFRFTTRDSAILYNSPPMVHPSSPLLVYPLDGQRILFANLMRNTFFRYTIPYDIVETGNNGCFPVSIESRFSQCGRYLHVARVTARKGAATNAPITLFIQVISVQLCSKSTCSGRPRTLSRRHGITLGKWPSTPVPRLPFVLTWTNSDVYVSLSTEMLKVFRIPFHVQDENNTVEGDIGCKEAAITVEEEIRTLEKNVVLSQSARFRPVYFLPAQAQGASKGEVCAKVILGSSYGRSPEPPAVVYLSQKSVGDWVIAKEAIVSSVAEAPMMRQDPCIEDFDAQEDCDLDIPFLDHQR